MRTRPVAALLLLAATLTAVLAGCSPVVATEPAADANDPGCADVIVRLPDSTQGLAKRETNAQATAAYGDPADVLLTCGVKVPAASELPCVQTKNVLWLRDDSKAPLYIFTTFGREPAIDVAIRSDQTKASGRVAPGQVLYDLSDAVSETTKNGLSCQDVEDSLGVDKTDG
ncbi:DUF3515 family protein [Schumannella soli]|nr:DUF3515 family protein [Schumannella soli]